MTMISLNEHNDRFECEMLVGREEVTVSIDKPVSKEVLEKLIQIVEESANDLLSDSLKYISESAAERQIEYIDDFTEPLIMLDESTVSVRWCSEKGEEKGAAIIGVDFDTGSLTPFDLTIGD